MGTLLGHALPGSFFFMFAIWRLIQTIRRQQLLHHFRRPNDVEDMFYTSATYPCYAGCISRWPVEGAFKVILTAIGMAGELWASTDYGRADHIIFIGDIQHVTMYSMFFLSGVVDIIVWCCPVGRSDYSDVRPACLRQRCGLLTAPPGIDFVLLSAAFVVETLLFSQHTHGRTDVDKLLHHLLLYVLAGTALSVLNENIYRQSLSASLATTFLLFIQGTWFFQVGLLLYPPPNSFHQNIQFWLYSQSDHTQTIMVTMIFCWHLAAGFILLLSAYVILRALFRRICSCQCVISDVPYIEYRLILNENCGKNSTD